MTGGWEPAVAAVVAGINVAAVGPAVIKVGVAFLGGVTGGVVVVVIVIGIVLLVSVGVVLLVIVVVAVWAAIVGTAVVVVVVVAAVGEAGLELLDLTA